MPLVPLNIYSTEGTRRTEIFACTASYTASGIHYRNLQRVFIAHNRRNHSNSSCRTVTRTVATTYTVCSNHTVLTYPYGMTYLYRRFNLSGEGEDGSRRTYLATQGTLWSAEAFRISHLRLHEAHNVCRRGKDVVRTFCNAELARCAMLCKMPYVSGARRYDMPRAVRSNAVFYNSETTINLLLLGTKRSCSGCSGRHEEEGAPRWRLQCLFAVCMGTCRLLLSRAMYITYRPSLAVLYTVHTPYTP